MGQQQQFSSGNKQKKLNVRSNQKLLWFPMDSTCKTQLKDQTNHHIFKMRPYLKKIVEPLPIHIMKKKDPECYNT